jgi:YhcH/YjgK/YiaL family protein
MVIGALKDIKKYLSEDNYQKIEKYLQTVSADMEEGEYEIDGTRIFARVMSYHTALRKDCKVEAHDKYIDIQSTLVGSEGIDIFHREALKELQSYDEAADVVFFEDNSKAYITVDNLPGYFSMIFPEEAHKPMISLNGNCDTVKKFVIKVQI